MFLNIIVLYALTVRWSDAQGSSYAST